MYVFISHSSSDAGSAGKVCALLEEAGNKCFIAPRDIRSGREYAEEIMLGIERSDAMVLMLSRNANTSPHVLREVEHAASRSIPILVYKMEEVTLTKSMEYFVMSHQWVNQKAGTDLSVIVRCVADLQDDGGRMEQNIRSASPAEGKPKRRIVLAAVVAVFAVVVLAVPVLSTINGRTGDTGQNAVTDSKRVEVRLGDAVTFGSYNGEPVDWRVIHLSEDGSRAVLLTEKIITMKAYDAAESDRYNIDDGVDYWKVASDEIEDKALAAKLRGNNEWSGSNIRTWLNSDAEVVTYEGGPPNNHVMSEMKNGYDDEAGFLYGFTDGERAAIVESEVESRANELSGGGTRVTSDRVFLLSLDELQWLLEAGVGTLAQPTEAAVSQDATGWYGAYSLGNGVSNYYWWLREPKEGSVNQCHMVTDGYAADVTVVKPVGLEGFGIRPAVTVDLRALGELMAQIKE